ncbi:MAG: beta-lactamase family protein [Taibaiella sp.]|nr:beta-lactamase family protein [Taibaiella sp.]
MSRSRHSYIATPIIFLFLLACHSKTQSVTAHTNTTSTSSFKDTPRKFTSTAVMYADTTTPENRRIIHELDAYYNMQARIGFNGSVLVGYKGQILYERYIGYSNKEQKVPLGPGNASQLASVSKTFTGAAILYLYQHKYIDIHQTVQHYLPEFPYPNITIKSLLDHRSGIADYTKWVPNYRKDDVTPVSNRTMLDLLSKYKPALEFRPDSRFKYCNTNFALLAMVIERVTDMNYRDFMRRYIFEPLGMTHTFVYDPWKGMPPAATISYKYNWRREPDMFADGVYGDKGIYSTVEDMYKWDQSFYQNRLLDNETIELAYGPCSFEKRGVKNYGLGWRMLCYPNGDKIIYHNGWWHGNNTSFYRFIKDNMTIIILGNKFNNGIYHQAPIIYSIVKNRPVMHGFDTEE